MNKRIPNGSWCLLKSNPGGTRNGKIVLAQHHSIADPDHGGKYTIKLYHSQKKLIGGEAVNEKITLSPVTNAFGYSDIVLAGDAMEEVSIIGELVAVLPSD
jgi:hypothetical protein